MAYTLFIDESGQDHHESPYEVLAGIAVEDSRAWNLITDIHEAEVRFFGKRVTRDHDGHELKARELLKRKSYKHAAQLPPIPERERTQLAHSCLIDGAHARRRELTALGQAKIAFVTRVLELCAMHQARAFASIVSPTAPTPTGTALRKDYAYLFERFYYFLEDQPPWQHGMIVFDELDRSRARILLRQMDEYFVQTARGRLRASRILPEPLFVHSDLTTLVQVADIIAYVISWGVQVVGKMAPAARPELAPLARAVCALRHRSIQERNGRTLPVWSFAVINDLRPRSEQTTPTPIKKGNPEPQPSESLQAEYGASQAPGQQGSDDTTQAEAGSAPPVSDTDQLSDTPVIGIG